MKKAIPRKLSSIQWQKFAPGPIIGVDEVGRGCLAGPVYAAAVILNDTKKLKIKYTDSKLLSESRREELFEIITREHRYAVGIASVEEIESMNILWASMLAMDRAVRALGVTSGHILVDGNRMIPKMDEFSQTAIIKGDLRVQPISAASIVAKVSRDRFMKELHEKFPNYGFSDHKGYGTENHLQALRKFGHSVHHRLSFNGVLAGDD
jgi:ribonuclease HII